MATLLAGKDGQNILHGTAGLDLMYGSDPEGPHGNVSTTIANRIAAGLNQRCSSPRHPAFADLAITAAGADTLITVRPTTASG